MVQHTATSVVTIERFIIEQERLHPEATGELSGILYDLALAAKMIANKVRSAGLADILGATERRERPGRDPAEARRLRQRDDHQGGGPRRPAVRHGVRGRAGHHPDPRALPAAASTACCSIRSTARPTSTSTFPSGRSSPSCRRSRAAARRDGGPAPAGPAAGRGGLRHLRLEHDARVHDGAGRARLHARSVDRRVPALAPEHPDARRGRSTSR